MAGTTRKSIITRLRGYDTQHTRATNRYANQIAAIYNEAAKEFAQLAAGLNFDPDKPFTFADYPQANKRAAQILADMTRRVRQVVETGTTAEWARANARADEYLFSILQRGKLTPQELAQYADRNLEALKAFQTRTTDGLNLSDRVWRINRQFNGQMELAIDVALGDGRSAAELSRDVRGLLNQPDKLFRRVRDKYGNLQLSRAAALYHPGRGVYRSSAMNAMRLARTEINMAYKTADWQRWQQLDFVVGIRISLSNNHTIKDSKGREHPFVDICDELAGDYPKQFKFTGWHPQCRCLVTPILQTQDEMRKERRERLQAIMNGKQYDAQPSAKTIREMPQCFRDHIEAIAERSTRWSSQPYYIRDNFRGGTIEGGLRDGIERFPTISVPRTKSSTSTAGTAGSAEEQNRAYSLSSIIDEATSKKLTFSPIKPLGEPMDDDKIIKKVGIVDKTAGSCTSLALAFIANKLGYDVSDGRGGKSCNFFADDSRIARLTKIVGGTTLRANNEFGMANQLLSQVQKGKYYFFSCGEHAAIVRRTNSGLQYLELQMFNGTPNGFKPLDNTALKYRFGVSTNRNYAGKRYESVANLIELERLNNNSFFELLGFLNK